MIVVADDLIPDVIGSRVGLLGDGCGIRFSGFGCGAEGVLHRAARQRRVIHSHQRLLRPVEVAVIRGDGGRDRVRLIDGHGHFFGCLCVGAGLRCRYNDIGFSVCRNRLDVQRAGGSIYLDIVSAAFLDRIADVSTACRRIGHSGADALIRVAIGGGHIFSRDCLCALVADRQGAVCIADRVIITRSCAGSNDVIGACRGIIRGGRAAVLLIGQHRSGGQCVLSHKSGYCVEVRAGECRNRAAHIDALILRRDGDCCLADVHGHVLCSRGIAVAARATSGGLSSGDGHIGFAVCRNRFDGQCTGRSVHVNIVLTSGLNGVADLTVSIRCCADALVRVAVGGGHVGCCDCLCVPRRDRQRAFCIADRVIITCGCAGRNDVIGSCRSAVRGGRFAVFLIGQSRVGRQRFLTHKPCDGIEVCTL